MAGDGAGQGNALAVAEFGGGGLKEMGELGEGGGIGGGIAKNAQEIGVGLEVAVVGG